MSNWWLLLISRSSRDSATTGSGEQRIPVDRGTVDGEDQGAAGAFVDQFVEAVGLGRGEFAHGEVVHDEHRRAGELA